MEPTQEDDLLQRMAEELFVPSQVETTLQRENDEEQRQRTPKAELQSILDSFVNYAVEVLDDDVFQKIAPLIDSISEEICK